MIQREWKEVTLLKYDGSTDEYGQLRQDKPTEKTIKAVLKPYIHVDTDDIRFTEVQFLALTDEEGITDANALMFDGLIWNISYVIPGRHTQLFLKRQR